ncbi:unnamed protein product [Urochloa humidicola]
MGRLGNSRSNKAYFLQTHLLFPHRPLPLLGTHFSTAPAIATGDCGAGDDATTRRVTGQSDLSELNRYISHREEKQPVALTLKMNPHRLSKKSLEIVHYALRTVDNQQMQIVRRNATKLCLKPQHRLEFQYGLFEELNVISYAAEEGNQFLFEVLLECCRVDPKIPHTKLQTTPLHHAAAFGRLEMIDILVTEYDCPLDHPDCCGSTALHHAILSGKTDAAIRLVDLGASMELDNFFGSPLHSAAFHGDHVAVDCLYETQPEIVDHVHGFCTPLIAAMCGGSTECVKYIAKRAEIDGQSLAYKAVTCCQTEELAVKFS